MTGLVDAPRGDHPVVVTPAVLREHPLPDHGAASSKHDRGGVLVVAGTEQTPGAALLAAVASLRGGAGRLQIATAAAAAAGLALAVPEARVIGVPGATPEAFDAAAVDELGDLVGSAAAVLVGSGTFTPDSTRRLVRAAVDAMADGDGVLVLDAGALPLLAEDPGLVAPLAERAVLMPNPSEMAQVLGADDDVTDDPARHLAEAVDRFGCVVTLRGGETWTMQPGGPAHRDDSGCVGLATCGSGDVLAGLLAGLAARGTPALDAVLWAVHAHGHAGRRCAARVGEVGFLARELLDELGPVLRHLSA